MKNSWFVNTWKNFFPKWTWSIRTFLYSSSDKRVRVWQWRSGTGYIEAYFSPLQGHKYGVTSVKVSPRSTMLASASIDGTTLLWNLRVSFYSSFHSVRYQNDIRYINVHVFSDGIKNSYHGSSGWGSCESL